MNNKHPCPFCQTELSPDQPRCSFCGAENMFYGVYASIPDPRRPTPSQPTTPTTGGGPLSSTGECPFCGGVLRSDEKTCPNCGAENARYVEDSPRNIQKPRTIEELQEYCAERGMPLLRMRFFIGEDYRKPKAFGIYRDGNDVVVYKNKADGSRAVRYRGPDEEHAVNELFQKLLSECHNRGIYPDGKPVTRSGGTSCSGSRGASGSRSGGESLLGRLWDSFTDADLGTLIVRIVQVILILVVLVMLIFSLTSHRNDGYYSTGNGTVYYRDGSDWYYSFDDGVSDEWYAAYTFPESNYEDYSLGRQWDSDWGVSNVRDSDVWEDSHSSSSSDSDSWSSSDYDSWDSGGTDWDSDW